MIRLYVWDDFYEMAEGCACGDPELKAKDNVREYMESVVFEKTGITEKICESMEEEIDNFLEKSDTVYLFNRDGHFVTEISRYEYENAEESESVIFSYKESCEKANCVSCGSMSNNLEIRRIWNA